MTYLLGWSTHRISAEEWEAMSAMLDGDVAIVGEGRRHDQFNPRIVSYRSLVDAGIAAEYPINDGTGFTLTLDGARFAREFVPEHTDAA